MSHRACVDLQPVAKVLDTLYRTLFWLNWPSYDLVRVIPPLPLIKVASIILQDNAQNMEEQQL